ncbi:adenylosuccinate lyase [Clostridium cylindrosporum]|uniref:Adenylosuccinate lyase n=1 Tax=Clostridium cylindrosporum DSM 605 TaxID=1121307 RepID=A0A0J8DB34_CLOCY|nr:adenylosuccinate lyase [Clostridium cylindrosporum]KMT23042.1 adenylosuccinate lyase PurB [Clostridium cylindrosporum DSM 605]
MYNKYESPLISRYSSKEMSYLFSEEYKIKNWRKLWVALAEVEKELGLNISESQINELKANIDNIDFELAKKKEKETRHDVMSHVYAYGAVCNEAKGIIHLGATSCYVGDNAEVIAMKEAMLLVRKKLIQVIKNLSNFALKYKSLPTLGFTHFQAAQLTTVGKRATLWIQELLMDLENLNFAIDNLKLLGVKGTTGTQASFLSLFDEDHEKVKLLEKNICKKMGFENKYFKVTGQTYPRKQDMLVLNSLSSIAQSAYKFGNDIRLLQNLKEVEEPFEKNQIGSSAMAYKRNPMRTERICALSRFVIINSLNPAITASTQWFERTLDDSANKRLSTSEAFLTLDAILNLYINVSSNLVVYSKVIEKHIYDELPFMATENILMEAVKKGGDRQELHEKIRVYSMESAREVKEFGRENDLIDRICNDPVFNLEKNEILSVLKPENYIGRSTEQVEEFIEECVSPAISDFEESSEVTVSIEV